MIYVKTENELNKLPNPQEGDMAVIDNGKVKVFKNGKWDFVKPKGGITMNLYELNKNTISLMDDITDIEPEKEKLREFRNKIPQKYYMLLSNECHYYTIFALNTLSRESFEEEVIGCLQDMGTLKLIDNDYEDRVECWISNASGCHMFMLFPYEKGVIACH